MDRFEPAFEDRHWIWCNEADEANEIAGSQYIAFRKAFHACNDVETAVLHVSASSRYVLWINGEWIGQGPVRGWPDAWPYDTYDITSVLQNGTNSIAILVLHYGNGNFQYIPQRGGLIANLQLGRRDGSAQLLVTDPSWKCRSHPSYSRSAPRMNCQLDQVEIFDARLEPEGWTAPAFSEGTEWKMPYQIAGSGEIPWTGLNPREIPFLTNDASYPIRLYSSRAVSVADSSWLIDMRPYWLPQRKDANPARVDGAIATVLHIHERTELILRLQDRTTGLALSLKVNGREIAPIDESGMHWAGLYAFALDLEPGEHMLVFYTWDRVVHECFFDVRVRSLNDAPVPMPSLPHCDSSRFAVVALNQMRDEERCHAVIHASNWDEFAKNNVHLPIPQAAELPYNPFHDFVGAEEVQTVGQVAANPHYACNGSRDAATIFPLSKGQKAELVYEFSEMAAGHIEFEVCAPEGTSLAVLGVEELENRSPLPTWSVNNTLQYTSRSGWQRYRSLVRRGLRYLVLQIGDAAAAVQLRYVRCMVQTYPFPQVGQFRCSEPLLEQAFAISSRTARLCSEDTFVDCPTYEQAFWVGDARIGAAVTYGITEAVPLVRRSLLLAARSMHRSPIVESQVPSSWQNILATWSLLWSVACEEYYAWTHDAQTMEILYPYMSKQVAYIGAHCTDRQTGLIASPWWNLLEWAELDTPTGAIVTHINAWYAESCRRTASIARMLGHIDDAVQMEARSNSIAAAMNQSLWDPEKLAYMDRLYEPGETRTFSEQTNAICLLCHIVPPEQYETVLSYIGHAPAGFVRTAGPFMHFFGMEALEQAGRYEEIVQRIRSSWGPMIRAGSTTCWEDLPGRWDERHPTRSRCHLWSTAPAYFLPRVVLGVRPLADRWGAIRISPFIAQLEWAAGEVNTPLGPVAVSWAIHANGFVLQVGTTTARQIRLEVILPVSAAVYARLDIEGRCSATSSIQDDRWVIGVEPDGMVKITAGKQ